MKRRSERGTVHLTVSSIRIVDINYHYGLGSESDRSSLTYLLVTNWPLFCAFYSHLQIFGEKSGQFHLRERHRNNRNTLWILLQLKYHLKLITWPNGKNLIRPCRKERSYSTKVYVDVDVRNTICVTTCRSSLSVHEKSFFIARWKIWWKCNQCFDRATLTHESVHQMW